MDDIRNRFLRDRVMTASPAQRVAMLYDRLGLDLARAAAAGPAGSVEVNLHLQHATDIVAELLGSLDRSVGGPAENLVRIYHYLICELVAAQLSGDQEALAPITDIVATLGSAWTAVASGAAEPEAVPVGAGAGWTA